MRLLYVTSFGPDIYAASGVNLVTSFLATGSEGDLLLATESGAAAEVEHPRIRNYRLEESSLLRDWLAANRDLIPPELGGTAPPCGCPPDADPFTGHRPGCPGSWWNRNASRWFRKVAALAAAGGLSRYDAWVWVDADCRFLQLLPAGVVASWFGDASVFVLKGPSRPVVDSGVFGLRSNTEGRRYLDLVVERFRGGEFRADERWDDGYQFQQALDRYPAISRRDLAGPAVRGTHVVENSPVGLYLAHDKGLHGRLRLMR